MALIEGLNLNSGMITGIATVALTFVTGYYVYLTKRLLKENQMMRLAAIKPEIAISLVSQEADINTIMLCIENIGAGPAHNVQFETDLSFKAAPLLPLEDIGILKNGISNFWPGQKFQSILVTIRGIDHLNELKGTPLEITVCYKDTVEHDYEAHFRLDFAVAEGLSPSKSLISKIVQNTNSITTSLDQLTGAVRALPVVLGRIISTELLSKYHLDSCFRSLAKRIDGLPDCVQQEIFQDIEVVVSTRECEIREREQNVATET